MQRILVVDDDHVVADSLAMIFSVSGFACRARYSTEEALSSIAEFRPDLLVCDIHMPERNGLELMREVSHTLPECRILVLTGHTRNLQRVVEESSYLLASVAVLTKPCPPVKLLREAGTMLQVIGRTGKRFNGTGFDTWNARTRGDRHDRLFDHCAHAAE